MDRAPLRAVLLGGAFVASQAACALLVGDFHATGSSGTGGASGSASGAGGSSHASTSSSATGGAASTSSTGSSSSTSSSTGGSSTGGSSSSASTSSSVSSTASTATSSASTSSTTTASSSSSSGTMPCTTVGPSTLAAVDSATGAASGLVTQRHLLYSARMNRWWYFYLDAAVPNLLFISTSSDFKTWTMSSTTMCLPQSASPTRGSQFSVDLYSGSTQDFAEIMISLPIPGAPDQLGVYHLRAELQAAGTAAFDPGYGTAFAAPTSNLMHIDHVSAAASAAGDLGIVTGLVPTGGDDGVTTVFSRSADDGTPGWKPASGWASQNVDNTGNVNAAQIVATGQNFMALADDAIAAGQYVNVNAAIGTFQSFPSALSPIFASSGMQDTNGWSAAVSSAGTVGVVRYLTSGSYEHAVFTGNWNMPVVTIDDSHQPIAQSGVLTVADGNNFGAVILDSFTPYDVYIMSSANGWTWKHAVTTGSASPQSLSGYNVANAMHQVAVTWTDTGGPKNLIKGALICVP